MARTLTPIGSRVFGCNITRSASSAREHVLRETDRRRAGRRPSTCEWGHRHYPAGCCAVRCTFAAPADQPALVSETVLLRKLARQMPDQDLLLDHIHACARDAQLRAA